MEPGLGGRSHSFTVWGLKRADICQTLCSFFMASIHKRPSFFPSQSAGGGIWDADAEYLSMSGGCQIWSLPGYLVTDSRPDICVTTRSVTPAYIFITPATCASYTINQKLHKTLICLFFSWSLHEKCTRNTIFIQV